MEITPVIVEKIAYNFSGLCLNAIDLLTTQKRSLLCKPKRERERPYSYTDPETFLSNVTRLLPPVKRKQFEETFPQAAVLRRKEVRDVVGWEPEIRWFDFGIMSRHGIRPHRGESSLTRIYHAYFLVATHPETRMEAVEIIDEVVESHHLLVNNENKSPPTFSAAVIYYIVNEEIIPRLVSAHKDGEDLEGSITTFGVFTTAVQDYDVRGQILALPPL